MLQSDGIESFRGVLLLWMAVHAERAGEREKERSGAEAAIGAARSLCKHVKAE